MSKLAVSFFIILSTTCFAQNAAISDSESSLTMLFGDRFVDPISSIDAFTFSIGSRFIATTTKEQLQNATSVNQILPTDANPNDRAFDYVETVILDESEIKQTGSSHLLNLLQVDLLGSLDYGSNFYIKGNYVDKTRFNDYLIYYISVVPEQQAEYQGGNNSLAEHLRQSSRSKLEFIDAKEIQSGRIMFTVSETGDITSTELDSTCGFSSIDAYMLDLLKELPSKWEPARNDKGEAISQEFILFFGNQGC